MNYDEITKITAERISDYMTEAVNTDSIAVAEMFHNAAWGVRTLWFELVTKIDIDIHKKNRYASYDLRRKIEMQHEEGNDSNLLIVFYVQIMPDDFVMQLHRF
ncbi:MULTISPECIES: hypothetical protein [Enterobacteriaceae]|nr:MULTISPECIES: hypothetical protein [Enterobacteriaceae]SYT90677.1 Uncharacterised protein [Klebsiella pneumoniae]